LGDKFSISPGKSTVVAPLYRSTFTGLGAGGDKKRGCALPGLFGGLFGDA